MISVFRLTSHSFCDPLGGGRKKGAGGLFQGIIPLFIMITNLKMPELKEVSLNPSAITIIRGKQTPSPHTPKREPGAPPRPRMKKKEVPMTCGLFTTPCPEKEGSITPGQYIISFMCLVGPRRRRKSKASSKIINTQVREGKGPTKQPFYRYNPVFPEKGKKKTIPPELLSVYPGKKKNDPAVIGFCPLIPKGKKKPSGLPAENGPERKRSPFYDKVQEGERAVCSGPIFIRAERGGQVSPWGCCPGGKKKKKRKGLLLSSSPPSFGEGVSAKYCSHSLKKPFHTE